MLTKSLQSKESTELLEILCLYQGKSEKDVPSLATALRRAAAGFNNTRGIDLLIKYAIAQGCLNDINTKQQTALDLALTSEQFMDVQQRLVVVAKLLTVGAKHNEKYQGIINYLRLRLQPAKLAPELPKYFEGWRYLFLMMQTVDKGIFNSYKQKYINLFQPKFPIVVEKKDETKTLSIPEIEKEFKITYCEMVTPSNQKTAEMLLAWYICEEVQPIIFAVIANLEKEATYFKIKWMGDDLGYGLFTRKNIPLQTVCTMLYAGELMEMPEGEGNAYTIDVVNNYKISAENVRNLAAFAQHSFMLEDFSEPFKQPVAKPIMRPIVDEKAIAKLNGFHIPQMVVVDIDAALEKRMPIFADEIITYDYGCDYWKSFYGRRADEKTFDIKIFRKNGNLVTDNTYILGNYGEKIVTCERILKNPDRSISVIESKEQIIFVDGLIKEGGINVARAMIPIGKKYLLILQKHQLAFLEHYRSSEGKTILHLIDLSQIKETSDFLRRCCSSDAAWELLKETPDAFGMKPFAKGSALALMSFFASQQQAIKEEAKESGNTPAP